MERVVLYIHGKGGSYLEAEQYKKNCPGFDIIGIDYEVDVPWIVENKIQQAYDEACKKYGHIGIIANSIGAYFAMHTLQRKCIEKALFISPIVDMEKLILDMMSWRVYQRMNLPWKGKFRQILERHCLGNICVLCEKPQSAGESQQRFYMGRKTSLLPGRL